MMDGTAAMAGRDTDCARERRRLVSAIHEHHERIGDGIRRDGKRGIRVIAGIREIGHALHAVVRNIEGRHAAREAVSADRDRDRLTGIQCDRS